MRRSCRGSGVALAILFSMSSSGSALSAKPKAVAKAAAKVEAIVAGDLALAAGDGAAAGKSFADAYRKGGPPSLLCRMGRAAAARGQSVLAQDYVRRCLQEGGAQPAERAALD